MEKDLNEMTMRLKESYGWHFPELTKLIDDNFTYVKTVKAILNRDTFEDLEKINFLDDEL